MHGVDPQGLISATGRVGARVQAYRPLAQGRLLGDETLTRIGNVHGKTSAQVGLRWVVQLGHVAITTTQNIDHMKQSLDIFQWHLEKHEMEQIARIGAPNGWEDNIVGEMCIP